MPGGWRRSGCQSVFANSPGKDGSRRGNRLAYSSAQALHGQCRHGRPGHREMAPARMGASRPGRAPGLWFMSRLIALHLAKVLEFFSKILTDKSTFSLTCTCRDEFASFAFVSRSD